MIRVVVVKIVAMIDQMGIEGDGVRRVRRRPVVMGVRRRRRDSAEKRERERRANRNEAATPNHVLSLTTFPYPHMKISRRPSEAGSRQYSRRAPPASVFAIWRSCASSGQENQAEATPAVNPSKPPRGAPAESHWAHRSQMRPIGSDDQPETTNLRASGVRNRAGGVHPSD